MEFADIHRLLVEQFGDAVTGARADGPEPLIEIAPARIVDVARFLRDDPRLDFALLMCLSSVDWDGYDATGKGKSVAILGYRADGTPETSERAASGELAVVYHLYSYTHRHKVTLSARLPRVEPALPTVSEIWPTAAWHEREAWDLMGVVFHGHPDLRRILLEDGWVGHPLRKDYAMPDVWQGVPLKGQPYAVSTAKPVLPPPTPPAPPAAGPAKGEPT